MKEYRINVRFNLENETDRMIVAYLNRLREAEHVSRNQFVINAIYAQITDETRNTALIERFRTVLREELSAISISPAQQETPEPVTDFSLEVNDVEIEQSKEYLRAGLELFA